MVYIMLRMELIERIVDQCIEMERKEKKELEESTSSSSGLSTSSSEEEEDRRDSVELGKDHDQWLRQVDSLLRRTSRACRVRDLNSKPD